MRILRSKSELLDLISHEARRYMDMAAAANTNRSMASYVARAGALEDLVLLLENSVQFEGWEE